MPEITTTTTKDEIITSALELTDTQSTRIKRLEEQQSILFIALGLLTTLVIL